MDSIDGGEMEDERRWDELLDDCLMNIFGRVGMESLLLDVPFVCKSWHKVTLIPLCWQNLVFPDLDKMCDLRKRFKCEYRLDRSYHFSETAFVKFLICRSKGKAVNLRLPPCASEEVLKYAADECPFLKTLRLPNFWGKVRHFPQLIGKWTNLEHLALGLSYHVAGSLEQISIHQKNLCSFSMEDTGQVIDQDSANAIVNYLPNLKHLILKKTYIQRDALVTVLLGCRELVQLDVSNSFGFEEDDEEITKLASHIANFCSQGSTWFDPDLCDEDCSNYD